MSSRFSLLAVAFAALAACKSLPSPVEQRASTEAMVRAAEEAGADRDPQAQLYLKLAREGLEKAKIAMENEENERADRILKKSEADAELARGLARQVNAEREAEEMREAIKKVAGGGK